MNLGLLVFFEWEVLDLSTVANLQTESKSTNHSKYFLVQLLHFLSLSLECIILNLWLINVFHHYVWLSLVRKYQPMQRNLLNSPCFPRSPSLPLLFPVSQVYSFPSLPSRSGPLASSLPAIAAHTDGIL